MEFSSTGGEQNMKLGVLLINTGTPDEPTLDAVSQYLREFLMDPAIIGAPAPVRRLLVNHIVRNRPARTVKHYEAFWTPAGSPFLLTSLQQRDALQKALEGILCGEQCCGEGAAGAREGAAGAREGGANKPSDNCASESEAPAFSAVHTELAMRYGNPSISSALEKLRAAGCTHLVFLPAYPQNVNVCAGTCLKEAHAQLRAMRGGQQGWQPETYHVPHFYDAPGYREALLLSVCNAWNYTPGAKLAVSFHSTMMSDIKRDPTYLRQTTQTKDWLAQDLHAALGIPEADVQLCFQSRFDSRKWLSPFTEGVLKGWVREGVKNICVVCPGFVADNIETMVEVNSGLRETVCGGRSCAQNERRGSNRKGSKIKRDATPATKRAAAPATPPGHFPQNTPDVMQQVANEVDFTYVPALGTTPGLIAAMAHATCRAVHPTSF